MLIDMIWYERSNHAIMKWYVCQSVSGWRVYCRWPWRCGDARLDIRGLLVMYYKRFKRTQHYILDRDINWLHRMVVESKRQERNYPINDDYMQNSSQSERGAMLQETRGVLYLSLKDKHDPMLEKPWRLDSYKSSTPRTGDVVGGCLYTWPRICYHCKYFLEYDISVLLLKH